MKAADSGIDRSGAEKTTSIFERVDDSGVPAAGKQNEAAGSVEDERLIVGNGVFDPGRPGVDLSARWIILFGVDARNRTGEPDTWENLLGFVVHDEDAAGGFVV